MYIEREITNATRCNKTSGLLTQGSSKAAKTVYVTILKHLHIACVLKLL